MLGTSAPGVLQASAGLSQADNIKVAIRVRAASEADATVEARTECIRVAQVRVPPLRACAQASNCASRPTRLTAASTPLCRLQDGTHVTLTGPDGKQQALHFHCCLGPDATQADVLHGCGASQLMDAAMAGYHATIFAHGQTGSGKTYTMLGREDAATQPGAATEGITLRCMRHIYDAIERGAASQHVIVRASCLEVYNERLYDLLHPSGQQLPLKWEAGKGFFVPDLRHVECGTLDKMLRVARTCVRHRRTGSHTLNHESSRSHAILTVYLEMHDTAEQPGQARFSKVSFVDLAGSERVKETGAAGGTLREANSINKSLFTLGKVIATLSDGVRSAAVHIASLSPS